MQPSVSFLARQPDRRSSGPRRTGQPDPLSCTHRFPIAKPGALLGDGSVWRSWRMLFAWAPPRAHGALLAEARRQAETRRDSDSLSTVAPHGGALYRLACSRWQQESPVPWGGKEPTGSLTAYRGHQSPAIGEPRSAPRWRVATQHHLTTERASPGRQKWDLTSGTAHPGWRASTHFHAGASVRT